MRRAEPHKGRPCLTCKHPMKVAIDRDLVTPGVPLIAIAKQYGLHRHALARHRKQCVASLIKAEAVQAHAADEAEHGASLTERVDALYAKADSYLEKMVEAGDFRGATAAVRELRGCLELIGKLHGQIDPGTTINVFNGPAWVTMQTNVLAALALYPDARAAVVRALDVPDAVGSL